MRKTTTVITLALLAAAGPAVAQDQQETDRPAPSYRSDPVDIRDSIDVSSDLDAPDYFERGGEGDNLGNHQADLWLDMNNFHINRVADPINPQDAATKAYVDGMVADIEGGGGGGGGGDDLGDHVADMWLDMSNYHINQVADPINPQDAATKSYVDKYSGDNLGNHIATRDLDMGQNTLVNMGNLDMEWRDLERANLRGTRLYDNIIHTSDIWQSDISRGSIRHAEIGSSEMHNSEIRYTDIRRSQMYFMTANDLTVMNGYTEWNDNIWMKGNLIKEAKIGISLDINGMPLLNVPDPTAPQDGANKRYVDTRIADLQRQVDDLEARLSALESN